MKLIITALLVILGIFILKNRETNYQPIRKPLATATLKPDPSPLKLNYNNRDYAVYLQKIEPDKVILIPNFTEKKSAATLMKEFKCKYGVNGGFYTPDHKPLGVFHAGEFDQRKSHNESLFNGYVHKPAGGSLHIGSEYIPNFRDISIEFIFQSGPLFTPQTKLKMQNDELARRMLIGKTGQEEYFFLAVTEAGNVNSGPYLADLPQILTLFNNSQPASPAGKQLTTLLNLDGGSASAFRDDVGVTLGELTPIGSFLCGRETP
ncbi:MAG: phosphodiester glycosidase family protein [Patescibacteria group bacterium]